MTTGGNGDDPRFGSEEPTKPGEPVGDVGRAISNLALNLNEVVRDLRESARLVDRAQTDERRYRLFDLAAKLGQLGDIAHDTRRAVAALAQL